MYNSRSDEVDCPKSYAKTFGRKTELPTRKCGEILVADNESFNYLCTFCGTLLKDIKTFSSHFGTYHMNQFKKENEIESCEVLSQNYFHFDERLEKSKDVGFEISEDVGFEISEDVGFEISEDVGFEISKDVGFEISKDVFELDETTDLQIESKVQYSKENIKEQIDKPSSQSTTNEAEAFELPQQSETRYMNDNDKIKKNIQLFCFYCDICNTRFFRKDALKSHKIYDHLPPNPFIDIEADQNESNLVKPGNNKTTNNKKLQHACKYCCKKFSTKKRRFEHECIHTGDKPYECEICHNHYRQSTVLKKHLETHKNERKYKCEICGKGFNDKTNLYMHIRRHNNDKRYKCDYCDKTFIYNTEKKSHELVHTGVKSYQCAECGLTWMRKGTLRIHMLRKHTSMKPFKCNYCDKTFSSGTDRKYHEAIHLNLRPFKCDECDATFVRKRGLKRHQEIHSDVFGYVCNVCGKSFKQHAKLYWHKKRQCAP